MNRDWYNEICAVIVEELMAEVRPEDRSVDPLNLTDRACPVCGAAVDVKLINGKRLRAKMSRAVGLCDDCGAVFSWDQLLTLGSECHARLCVTRGQLPGRE